MRARTHLRGAVSDRPGCDVGTRPNTPTGTSRAKAEPWGTSLDEGPDDGAVHREPDPVGIAYEEQLLRSVDESDRRLRADPVGRAEPAPGIGSEGPETIDLGSAAERLDESRAS